MPKSVRSARIACLDMNLQKARMHFGVQVLVTDPAELERIRERELDITRERVQKIIDAGAARGRPAREGGAAAAAAARCGCACVPAWRCCHPLCVCSGCPLWLALTPPR